MNSIKITIGQLKIIRGAYVVTLGLLILIAFVPLRSCQSDNGFRVEHSAGSDGWMSEPINLDGYASQNIPFKLAAGTHCFLDSAGHTYLKTFAHDTAINNPRKFYNQLFEHSARMLGGSQRDYGDSGFANDWGVVRLDTTKKPIPQQKIVYHNYELKGSDTLFYILLKQIGSPLDVTPRELQKLQSWINTSIKVDSTK